jgi:hypothetical protein
MRSLVTVRRQGKAAIGRDGHVVKGSSVKICGAELYIGPDLPVLHCPVMAGGEEFAAIR